MYDANLFTLFAHITSHVTSYNDYDNAHVRFPWNIFKSISPMTLD